MPKYLEKFLLFIGFYSNYSDWAKPSDDPLAGGSSGWGNEDSIYGWFYDPEFLVQANDGDIVSSDIELYFKVNTWFVHPPTIIAAQRESTYNALGLTPIESDIFQYYDNLYDDEGGYGISWHDIYDISSNELFGYIKYQDVNGNIITVKYGFDTCLKENTEILIEEEDEKKKKRRRKKKIQDITYKDNLVVWDFDKGEFTTAKPLWIMKPKKTVSYNLLKFSDGSELCTIEQHRIFNKEAGKFTYPMTDDTPIGTTTFNSSGEEVKLISKEIIQEQAIYYNIITNKHMNLFANGILTSCRLNNIYPIKGMKFVKDNRILLNDDQLKDIPKEYIDGLRLKEQVEDINRDGASKISNDLLGYIKNLLYNKKDDTN